jgi:hypothetical protein
VQKEDTVDTQLMDPALLTELPSMSTETLLLQSVEEVNEDVVHAPFELDENTMRSLQQFIDSHGFQSPPNQVLCDIYTRLIYSVSRCRSNGPSKYHHSHAGSSIRFAAFQSRRQTRDRRRTRRTCKKEKTRKQRT